MSKEENLVLNIRKFQNEENMDIVIMKHQRRFEL